MILHAMGFWNKQFIADIKSQLACIPLYPTIYRHTLETNRWRSGGARASTVALRAVPRVGAFCRGSLSGKLTTPRALMRQQVWHISSFVTVHSKIEASAKILYWPMWRKIEAHRNVLFSLSFQSVSLATCIKSRFTWHVSRIAICIEMRHLIHYWTHVTSAHKMAPCRRSCQTMTGTWLIVLRQELMATSHISLTCLVTRSVNSYMCWIAIGNEIVHESNNMKHTYAY